MKGSHFADHFANEESIQRKEGPLPVQQANNGLLGPVWHVQHPVRPLFGKMTCWGPIKQAVTQSLVFLHKKLGQGPPDRLGGRVGNPRPGSQAAAKDLVTGDIGKSLEKNGLFYEEWPK